MIQNAEIHDLQVRLERIETVLSKLVQARTIKEFYSTAEVAERLDRAEWTVREWCRLGRIHAKKRRTGRGPTGEWMISNQELERIMNEGLLPVVHTLPNQ